MTIVESHIEFASSSPARTAELRCAIAARIGQVFVEEALFTVTAEDIDRTALRTDVILSGLRARLHPDIREKNVDLLFIGLAQASGSAEPFVLEAS